jgi:hypothetical protein
MLSSERQRVPLSLQALFLASNRGQIINSPPPGNVAIRVFRSIFHRTISNRSSRRTICIDATTNIELGTTIQSSATMILHKPTSYCQPQTDHNGNQSEPRSSNYEIETPHASQSAFVDYLSVRSGSSNGTRSIARIVDSEEINYDNLYSSPVKYKTKLSIKP